MEGERKSTRVTKKPQFYAPPVDIAVVRQHSDPEDSEMEAPRRSGIRKAKGKSKAKVVGGVDTDTDDSDHEPVKAVTKKSRVRVPAKAKEVSIPQGSLLDKVLTGKFTNRDLFQSVDELKENKVEEVAKIMNFVLMCAGADSGDVNSPCISLDQDLDGLEADEISDLLSDTIHRLDEDGVKHYPLQSSNKTTRNLRANYRGYWLNLSNELRGNGDYDKHGVAGLEVLNLLVDTLISLSGMFVTNIRDAATEAALAVARSLSLGCVDLRGRLSTCERQLSTEKSGSSRHQAIMKNKGRVDTAYKRMQDMGNTIYQSVLLHRYRDTADSVRASCAHHLGEWISGDVTDVLKDEFLKYIGWMCSERSAAVRLEAVLSFSKIVQKSEAVMGKLKHFVERFMNRFIDIAVADVEEPIQFEMMCTLRTLQKRGSMDTLAEESLDKLDDLVFDSALSLRVRREAMQFVMDHTEGFDVEIAPSGATGLSSKKDKKKGGDASSSGADQSFAARRRNALLLESLTEFIEHHLLTAEDAEVPLDGAEAELVLIQEVQTMTALVAEACEDLPSNQGSILSDWPTIVAMLLRDSSSASSSNSALVAPLSSFQATILIHLFVSRAMTIRRTARNGGGTAESESTWDALTQTVTSPEFNKLLVRYKQDSANISALLLLLECCFDLSFSGKSCSSGAISVKSLTSGFKFIMELLSASADAVVIQRLVKVLSQWNRCVMDASSTAPSSILSLSSLSLSGSSSGSLMLDSKCVAVIKSNIEEVIASLWENITDALDALTSLSTASAVATAAKKQTKGKTQTTQQPESFSYLIQLDNNLGKLCSLFRELDCRERSEIFVESELSNVLLKCTEIASVAQTFVVKDDRTAQVNATCDRISTLTCDLQFFMLLWYTRIVYIEVCNPTASSTAEITGTAKNRKARETKKGGAADKSKSAVTVGIQNVLLIRDNLMVTLNDWMLLEDIDQDGNNCSDDECAHNSHLRRHAFRLLGDLRLLYPVRLMSDSAIAASEDASTVGQYRYVHELAYSLSQETLQAMKNAFEAERIYLAELLSINGDNAGAVNKLTDDLIGNILCPLASPLLFDMEHLNRRQAAAILPYIIHNFSPNDDEDEEETDVPNPVRDIIAAWMRRLKAANTIKFLEVQLVALKSYYHSNIVELLNKQIEDSQQSDNEDDLDYAEAIDTNYIMLTEFAAQLANTVTSTRLSGAVNSELISGLESFIRASIDYALSSVIVAAADAAAASEECGDGVGTDGGMCCSTLGYFNVVEAYVYLLPADKTLQMYQYLIDRCSECGVWELLETEEAKDDPKLAKSNYELQCYLDFKKKLAKKCGQRVPAVSKARPAIVKKGTTTNRTSVRVGKINSQSSDSEAEELEGARDSNLHRSSTDRDASRRYPVGLVLEDIPSDDDEEPEETQRTQETEEGDETEESQEIAPAGRSRSGRSAAANASLSEGSTRSRSTHTKRQRVGSQGQSAYIAEEEEDDIYATIAETGATRKRYR